MIAAEILKRRIFFVAAGNRVSDGTVPGISASRTSALPRCEGTAGIEAIRPRV